MTRKGTGLLAVAIVGGGFLAVGMIVAAVLAFAAIRPPTSARQQVGEQTSSAGTSARTTVPAAPNTAKPKPVESTTPKSPLTREQLRALVFRKNGKQVMEALGRPSRTKTLELPGEAPREWWYYEKASVDGISGKTDSRVVLRFFAGSTTGTVEDIEFIP